MEEFDFDETLLEIHDYNIDNIIEDQNPINLNYNKLKQELQAIEDKNTIHWIYRSNCSLNKLEGNTFDGFHQLIELDLSHNVLMPLSRGVFDQLINLQVVNLSHNLISELEDSLFRNNNQLKIINLSNNLITEINGRAFDNLNSLRKLDFSCNKIEKLLEKYVKSESLQELNLSHNQIVCLSKFSFYYIPNLIHLQLNNNEISYFNDIVFKNSRNIEYLNLSNNLIERLNKKTFANLYNLKIADFSNNSLLTLGKCFRYKPMLNELNLLNNPIISFCRNKITLSENIRILKLTIHELLKFEKFMKLTVLSDLEFHVKTFQLFPINRFLTWINTSSLQRLCMVIQRGVFNVSQEIKNLFNLEFLHIEFLEANEQFAIFNILSHINIMRKLKHLALINVNKLMIIDDKKTNYNILTYLDLTGINNVSVDFLRNNFIMLEYLNLSASYVSYISQDLMKTLPNLKYLIMNGTSIAIVEDYLFQYNSKLEVISFKDCQIQIIRESAFQNLENLKQIDIRGNKMLIVSQNVLNAIPKSAIIYYYPDQCY